MSEEELINNMMKISKSDLGGADWEGFIGDSAQYYSKIESKKRLELDNDYEELDDKEKKRIEYINIEDILVEDLFHKYIFLREENK